MLRPYQSDAINRLRSSFRSGQRALLLVAPTGAGKTVMFASMTQNAVARGHRVLILVHRQELVDQVQRAVEHLPHGLIVEGTMSNPDAHVQIASVQTVVNREIKAPDLIVIDEAHHAAAATWQKVLERWPNAWRLGVTATPERLDGKGLRDSFEEIVLGPTVVELQELGFLCKTRYFAPAPMDLSKVKTVLGDYSMKDAEKAARKIMGDAAETYRRIGGGRGVAFCCSISHAEDQALAFGPRWKCIHGGLSKIERRKMVAEFTSGEIEGLTSVDVISEGFDLPAIEVAILLRPTQSLSMHLQQIGRALRPYPGKDAAIILDHAGNIKRHGFAEDIREWSLDGVEGREKSGGGHGSTGKRCEACYFINPRGAEFCGDCGAELQSSVEIEVIHAEMRELKRSDPGLRMNVRRAIDELGFRYPLLLRQWRDVAENLGYKRGWAWHQFQNQKSNIESSKPSARLKTSESFATM